MKLSKECRDEALLNLHEIVSSGTVALIRGGKAYDIHGVDLTDDQWEILRKCVSDYVDGCYFENQQDIR